MVNDWTVILRLMICFLCGGVIGLEREKKARSAGLRTHILVSLGSALIMLTSLYVFDIYRDVATVDPSRIAAGVITGIGFIGAGTIIRYGGAVKGLTTAASLWITSAVGLAIGSGFYLAGIFSSIVVILTLHFLRNFEEKLVGRAKEE